jgi:hypothetical protein
VREPLPVRPVEPPPDVAETPVVPSRRRPTPVKPIPAATTVVPPAVVEPKPPVAPPAPAPAPQPRPSNFPLGLGLVWVALAIILGVALRFLSLPDYLVPILVGVGVGAVVIIATRYFLTQQPEQQSARPAPSARPRSSAARRLSGLKRRLATPARDMSEN